MIKSKSKIKKGLNPVFDKGDLKALRAYDAFMDKYHIEISENLRNGLKNDPVLGPIIDSQTEEERQVQEETSRQLQKAAIQDGAWEPYTTLLNAQAIAYAHAGLGFSDWVRIVMMYRDHTLKLIKSESHNEMEGILEIIDGQNKLVDYALNVIGSSFIVELKKQHENKTDQLDVALKVGRIGIWNWNMKNNYIEWDDSMYQLFDLRKSEFNNRYEDFEKRVHPEDREKVKKEVGASIESRKDFNTEFRVIHRDKSLHYLTGRGKVIFDEDGNPERMTGSNMDITDIFDKQVEINNIRQAIYKSNLVAEFTPDGTITYVNEKFLKLMGYAPDELIGRHHSILVTPTYKESEEYKTFWKTLSEGEYHEGEYPRLTKNQDIVWIKGNYNPIKHPNGKVYSVLKIATDMSLIKQAEERQTKFSKELENQVSLRTKELQESNKELQDFSYTVSHDLRAPIRAINGFSSVLEKKLDGQLSEEERHYLDVIRENVTIMGDLIDDLLDFSRIGRLEQRLAMYDMDKLVEQVFQSQTQLLGSSEVKLNIGQLPNTRSDREMIKQVWANLIGNAIKYASPDRQLVIHIGGEEDEQKNIYYVRDNGIGFEMEFVHKVFGIFQRLHDSESFSGTGVGLAIVQRIIDRHGGAVWAESKLGKGSTFYFSIPNNL